MCGLLAGSARSTRRLPAVDAKPWVGGTAAMDRADAIAIGSLCRFLHRQSDCVTTMALRPWVAERSQDPASSPLAVNAHDTFPPAYDSWLCLADSLVCLFYRQRIWPIACEATQAPSFEALSTMSIVPAL